MGSPDPGWKILLGEAILLRRVAILPRVVFTLIITQGLEDALHGGIADGLLGDLVDGLLGHFDSHFLWGGGLQLLLQPHGLVGYSLLLVLSDLRWAPSLVRWRRAILLDLGRVGHMLLSMQQPRFCIYLRFSFFPFGAAGCAPHIRRLPKGRPSVPDRRSKFQKRIA